MAKILVADDNSNIQKMVGLALKDQGIDVVAVGNGEAAVRKISDIRPDLVLADVFMPVRNGYEVCQYVKSDPSLAHIPVILLVGAFDPLDEQEAQRVGADGVLKKPFVPPDPLISMVKSALARAGVSIGGAASAPKAPEEPRRVAEMLTPRTAPAPSAISGRSALSPVPEMASAESEPMHDEGHGLPQPVRIEAGSQPLAFGSLLETTEPEQEEDLGFATTAVPELERDWKSGEAEEEEVAEEEDEKQGASWRRDAGDEAMDNVESGSGAVKDWRETAFAEAPARKMKHDSWAPQKEISTLEEAAESEQRVGAMVKDEPLAETKSGPSALPAYTEDAWVAALNQKTVVEAETMEMPAPTIEAKEQRVEAEVQTEVRADVAVSSPAKAEQVPEPAKQPESSWFSAVSSPWDAEAQKASRLASTWDSPTAGQPAASAIPKPVQAEVHEDVNQEEHDAVPQYVHEPLVSEDPGATVDALTPSLSEDVKAKLEEVALPAATVEAIREEAQHVAETAVQQAPALEANAKAPESSMEDMVAKVLSKMSPEMLQAVTREILKPVVEAMVRDELNAKK
ncbi:MAG: response regulator [Candidatus Acidiferrum sp.]